VKKEAIHYFSRNAISGTKNIDKYFEIYKSLGTRPDQLKLIEDKYNARLKTQKGAISPPFAYEDPNGKTITQEDLKGKLVYIDLWATWCRPCLREIPYFDTLQEAFKDRDITFVSICQNDTKERWQKAIISKNLKGLQLYAEGDGGQFYEDYQVTGIPRYIILDAEGKIIDSDAKRPSDKRLVEELQELLK
jgi:thiol-disulfide isomerase/thioredoxin